MSSTPYEGFSKSGPGALAAGIPVLPADFERALPAQLSQAEDLQRYLSASPAWVHVEYERVSRTLLRFAEAVVDAMESPRCAHDFLQRLDLRSISRDHNWRRIFAELVDSDPSFDGHKRTLVIRYLQFLSERKRLLAYVEAQHAGLEATADHVLSDLPEECSDATILGVGDTAVLAASRSGPQRFWLSTLRFELRVDDDGEAVLVGRGGFQRPVRLGRNVVGRHPECDVVLDPSWRKVSRVHAVLDWTREWRRGDEAEPHGVLRITNLSSRNTLVP